MICSSCDEMGSLRDEILDLNIFKAYETQVSYSFTDILLRLALLIRFAWITILDLPTLQEVKMKPKRSVVIDFLCPIRHMIMSISFPLPLKKNQHKNHWTRDRILLQLNITSTSRVLHEKHQKIISKSIDPHEEHRRKSFTSWTLKTEHFQSLEVQWNVNTRVRIRARIVLTITDIVPTH